MQVTTMENLQDSNTCSCGRSPTGLCVGFHSLSDKDWAEGKNQLVHNYLAGRSSFTEDITGSTGISPGG